MLRYTYKSRLCIGDTPLTIIFRTALTQQRTTLDAHGKKRPVLLRTHQSIAFLAKITGLHLLPGGFFLAAVLASGEVGSIIQLHETGDVLKIFHFTYVTGTEATGLEQQQKNSHITHGMLSPYGFDSCVAARLACFSKINKPIRWNASAAAAMQNPD
jgi:hypothetical protein